MITPANYFAGLISSDPANPQLQYWNGIAVVVMMSTYVGLIVRYVHRRIASGSSGL
jgi:hypothetical protein